VQGMNELCGTLYYVFASDENEKWSGFAEADTYHCFSLLIKEIQDVFIRQMDSEEKGIIGRIQQFVDLLRRHDPQLHDVMEAQGLDPAFYGLRWLTTILSREFNLADTIRLWDTLFADTNRNEFLSYVCCTMIIEQRTFLLANDFAENLGMLQSYPEIDVIYLLNRAMSLRGKDKTNRSMQGLQGHGHRISLTGESSAELSYDHEDGDETSRKQKILNTLRSMSESVEGGLRGAGNLISKINFTGTLLL